MSGIFVHILGRAFISIFCVRLCIYVYDSLNTVNEYCSFKVVNNFIHLFSYLRYGQFFGHCL